MIPVGIAIASNIMVGNNIGANEVHVAKYYAKMCNLTAFIWAVASVFFMNVLRSSFISIFSSSQGVNDLIVQAYALLSVFVFFDCMQGVASGIIRGLGK
jgi:MATE family multidrug resistance protein